MSKKPEKINLRESHLIFVRSEGKFLIRRLTWEGKWEFEDITKRTAWEYRNGEWNRPPVVINREDIKYEKQIKP